jgi:hypothetical protein
MARPFVIGAAVVLAPQCNGNVAWKPLIGSKGAPKGCLATVCVVTFGQQAALYGQLEIHTCPCPDGRRRARNKERRK